MKHLLSIAVAGLVAITSCGNDTTSVCCFDGATYQLYIAADECRGFDELIAEIKAPEDKTDDNDAYYLARCEEERQAEIAAEDDTGLGEDPGDECPAPLSATPSEGYPQVHVLLDTTSKYCGMGSGYSEDGVITMDLDGSGIGSARSDWTITDVIGADFLPEYNAFSGASADDLVILELEHDDHGVVEATLLFDPDLPSLVAVGWPDGAVSE